ncbi:S41 family peptidase [Kosmotoga olearia]|uniref:Peptidase S41 n=1 Tax=Kosmotoga olearia (strain ATCC BAA-1733 / DSM 21960 / TBF 19.5.1) TaxID=521045 RepID=C5CG44_KOSOT|nr:S41 family peptidase [Kosmotoga olearia]ACR79485.1 peptidase S41 [Kosmotoga olearia TBF 19.5.1]
MNKARYILIVILLLISTFTIAEKLFTPEQLREDLDFLVSKIVEEYYNPWLKVDETEFWNLVEEKRAQLDHDMTWSEFYKIAAPLVATLHDQHSFLQPPSDAVIRVFPFRLHRVKDKAVVINSVCELPVGAIVTKINGIPVENIIQELEMYGTYETPESRLNFLVNYFIQALPEWWGIEEFEITYLYKNEEKVLNLEATSSKYYRWITQPVRKRSPSFELHGSIGVLKVPSFNRSYKNETVKKMEEAIDSDITNLIIDVRSNSGGSTGNVLSLLQYFVDKPTKLAKGIGAKSYTREVVKYAILDYGVNVYPAKKQFSGKLWILTDEDIFSGTLIFLGFLVREGIGTILGERSSETANFGFKQQEYLLPNTNCSVDLSKARILLLEEGRHIEPDIPINLSLEEKIKWIIGEADPMLDEALRIVERVSEEQRSMEVK